MKIRLGILVLVMSVFMYSCKTASFYFNKAEKQYKQAEYVFAIENYKQAEAKGADVKECNYKIAEAYRRGNNIAESGDYYLKAIEAGTKHETSYLYYGLSLKAQGKYEDAAKYLQNYSKTGANRKVMKRAKFEYKKINQIDKIPEQRTKYKTENFEAINSEGDDYGTSFYGNKITFASARGESKLYGGTGFGFTDLYTFTYDDATTKTSGFVKELDETDVINQDYTHEAEATFSPEGDVVVFARGNDGSKKGDKDVQLFMSKMGADGNWMTPTRLPISDITAWNSSPSFSNDGKYLYFASNRKKGRGGIDIYRAEYKGGKFLHVKNMGKKINSVGNDVFPHEGDDGVFFFSSDGHVSYGGLDMFKIEKDKDGRYTNNAINLGNTINTPYDDFGMTFDSKHGGFFTSNRPDGKGRDDIYKFKEVVEPFYYLEAIVKGKTDSATILVDHAKLTLKQGDKVLKEDFTDAKGEFHIKLEKDKSYTILAQKDGFFSGGLEFTVDDKILSTLTKTEDGDYIIPELVNLNKISIKKLEPGETAVPGGGGIVLDDIFYALGSAEITSKAEVGLNKVVKLLTENPGISIELSSHTDSRDTDDKNQTLSQARAESAVAYIVSKGVASSRIVAKGYGEKQLINKCADGVECSEEEHQLNRRTEMAVTSVSNTFEAEHKEYEKSKLEAEMERLRIEELQHEMEAEEKRKHDEEDAKKKAEIEANKSDAEKLEDLKKKMAEMEKKLKEEEEK